MKKQIKKSFSLMLAVLMVLSCWVWVAPEKAEAGAPTSYDVTFDFSVPNMINGGTAYTDIYYIPNNGTGTETSKRFELDKLENTESDYSITCSNVGGWPSRIYIRAHDNGMTTFEIVLKGISINGKPVIKGQWTIEGGHWGDDSRDFVPNSRSGGDGTKGTVSGTEEGTWSWPKPVIAETAGDISALSLSLNTIGGADKSVKGTFNKWLDQYGVNWAGGYSATDFDYYLSTSAGGSEVPFVDADDNDVMWISSKGTNNATVTAKAALQMYHLYSEAQGKIPDVYLVAKREFAGDSVLAAKTSFSSAKINLTYPKYDWKFYGNGNGTVAATPTTKIEMGGTLVGTTADYPTNADNDVITSGGYKYYGQSIKDYYPTGKATKEGYTFYGFWTTQQPSSPANVSNPYAFEAEFLQPIDTETYNTMSAEDQARYTPAGVKFDPKNSELMTTKENSKNIYYAWWLSEDVTVKFYDINGKFLQEENVKYGQNNNAFTWPTPQQSYESGSFTYSNWTGMWENYDGEEVSSTGYTFTHDLILTPVYNTINFTDTYRVTVYNTYGANAWAAYTKDYNYRDTAVLPAANLVMALPANAQDYSYTFEGWSTTAPASGNYHVMLEDSDFDANGKAVYLVTDFTVRDNVSYYPVFRRHVKNYDVTFVYKDDQGNDKTVTKNFNFGDVITAPDNVPAEYATGGFGYTFVSWTRNNADVNLASQTCIPGLTYTARYSDGVPTPYNVTFIYKNSKGEDIVKTVEVSHGQFILQKTLDEIKPAENYDNGEALVTYNGIWEYNGTRYDFADLTAYSPVNHTTFTAVYENPQPFYTVTYVDGSKTESFRVIDGSALPFWMNKTENEDGTVTEELYLPKKADTIEGRYTFAGWFDEPQADENYAVTNGNRYGNQGASDAQGITTVTSDVTLYPQFTFGLFEYNIEFRNWNGALLSKGTFHYQDSIEALTNAAVNAAVRPADMVYTYQFIGWDKKVPEFCEGGEPGSTVTYIAQYKPVYIYYDVEWFNDEAAMTSGTALTTSKYVYGDRMHTPSVSLTVPTNAPEGQSYVFAGWYYKDAQGNAHPFNRNLTVTGDMQFYATYTLTKKTWDVTVDDGKNPAYTFTVEDGSIIKDLVSDPVAGYVDATKHNAFAGWTTGSVGGAAFEIETAKITADITIYANYTEGAHVLNKSEVTKYPTYPENGVEIDGTVVGASDGKGAKLVWCECSKENTKQTVEIAALKDEKLPSASTYVGTTKWESYDSAAADTTVVYAGEKTDLIVVTSDIGGHLACLGDDCTWCEQEALYNPTYKGIGIQAVYAYAAKAETPVNPAAVADWGTAVYNWDTIKTSLIGYYNGWENVPAAYKDYNANVTGKVGNLTVDGAALEDNVQYVVYYKIVDKAGNTSYMRTGAFTFDAKRPVVEISGDANLAKTKYCQTATITVTDENGATLTVNDEKVTLTEGKYTITEAGAYRIVATDAAGNKATASFDVLAAHETREIITEATCTDAGSKSQVCYNCGKAVGETETITALGHKLKTVKVDATCDANGYDKTTCERCDLAPVITEFAEDGTTPLYPALGHDLTTKTIVEPTCIATGTKKTTCSRCDYTLEETIAIDPDAHKFYKPVVVKATCTSEGRKTQQCRLCGTIELIETYEMTNHIESSDEKILEKASCWKDGSKTKYCTVCNANLGEVIAISKDTVLHTWVVDEANCKEPTATEEGVIAYKCSVDGCTATATETVAKIEQYTVTFMSEDGNTEIAKFTKIKGETIAADAVENPTKANSADKKYKYTFAGWYTKNAEGEYDTKYNLPMNVNADVTLYAKFIESEIVYTIQFKVPQKYEDGKFTDYKVTKELMGAIGDERVPAATPTFKADSLNTYEFTGWKRAGVDAGDSFVITGDATYEAQFKVVPKQVDVIFMNGATALKKVTVNVGGTAVYDGATPTKAADADNHYTFKGWSASLTNITVKTTVYAEFNAIAHTWNEGTVIQNADCVKPVITEFECTAEGCGYKKTVTGDALGHDESGEIKYDAATGENYKICAREGCGVEIYREKASYEIRFLNYNNVRLQVGTVEANGEVTYTGETPTKPTDAAHSYKFSGWKDSADNEYLLDKDGKVTLPKATKDETYTAIFTETDITYVVTFIDTNGDVLQQTECKYGADVAFTGDTTKIPVPDPDANGHYAFTGWNKTTTNITSDTVVRATYSQSEHDYEVSPTGATCETAGGNKHECKICEYSYVEGNIPATGHNWVVDYEVAPDFDNEVDGKIVYKCTNGCGKTKEETVNGHKVWVIVNVKDQNGNAYSGARVALLAKEADGSYTEVDFYVTLTDGVAKFYVKPGDYKVSITASGMKNIEYEVVVNEDGTVSGARDYDSLEKPHEDSSCSCSCHKNNFWGAIFRFFQKIIKLFTGKPSCCADYDSRI